MPQKFQSMETLRGSELVFGNMWRKPNVKIHTQRMGDFFTEELTDCSALRIGPPQQLALIPAKGQCVVSVPGSWLPRGLLPSQDLSQPIMVGQCVNR